MKRKIGILVLIGVLCVALVGCKKKEEKKIIEPVDEPVVGGWETVLTNSSQLLEEKEQNAFDAAVKDYTELELKAVALLGQQVVAGTNYMFLAKGYEQGNEENASYKIVVVYNDLNNNASLTRVSDFVVSKYASKDISNTSENLSGGWNVSIPGKPIMLEEDIQNIFDKAVENVQGITYYPIATVAKQVVAGTNYAVLCFGRPDDSKPEGIYLLTIYKDLQGNQELTSQAYVSLADYNQ